MFFRSTSVYKTPADIRVGNIVWAVITFDTARLSVPYFIIQDLCTCQSKVGNMLATHAQLAFLCFQCILLLVVGRNIEAQKCFMDKIYENIKSGTTYQNVCLDWELNLRSLIAAKSSDIRNLNKIRNVLTWIRCLV